MAAVQILLVSEPEARSRYRRAAESAGAEVWEAEPEALAEALRSGASAAVLVVAGDFDLPAVLEQVGRRREPLFVVGPRAAIEGLGATSARAIVDDTPPDLVARVVVAEARASAAPPGGALDALMASADEALDDELEETAIAVARARGGSDAALGRLQGAFAGRLDDDDLPVLLGRAFGAGTTGRLSLRRGEIERAIFFEAGRPVCVESTDAADRFGEALVRQGRVPPRERDVALEVAVRSDRRVGAVLVERGALTTSELLVALRAHHEELLLASFTWAEGTYALEPGVRAAGGRARWLRHPAALTRDGLLRYHDRQRLRARLGSPRNVWTLDARGARRAILDAFEFDAREWRVAALFDGARPLAEIPTLAGVDEATVWRVARALHAFSMLAAEGDALGLGTVLRDPAIERERVMARLAVAREGTYFAVLELEPTATADDVVRAHERICARLSDQSLGVPLAAELADELTELREVLSEARRVLASDGLRAAYSSALAEVAPRLATIPAIAG